MASSDSLLMPLMASAGLPCWNRSSAHARISRVARSGSEQTSNVSSSAGQIL